MSPRPSPVTPQTQATPSTGRFDSLDALRGVAALVVVLWHWQHFFFVGTVLPLSTPKFPLQGVLAIFYKDGEIAVDLFFCISGFIFYWLYANAIATGSMSAGRFFVLRFSRLYPLHLLTLVVVAALQVDYQAQGYGYFVYAANTASNFVINLLFVSGWVSRGFSFNAPVWSVSVEVFLYGLFFVMCRWLPISFATVLAACLFGLLGLPRFPTLLGRGMVSFFLGGTAALVYARLMQGRSPYQWSAVLGALVTTLWAGLVLAIALAAPGVVGLDFIRKFAVLALFPLTVLSLALWEHTRGIKLHRLTVLGDISYSTYLWHFPLQLATVVVFDSLGLSRQLFTSPLTLVAFFLVLIGVGYVSVHWFERPAQAWLRGRFRSDRSSRAA